MDENLDKKGGITEKKEKVVDIINKTIQNFDLIDIWRLRNPDIKQFTWRQKNEKVKCRLDYWLISNFMQDSVAKVDILPFIKSDHSAVVLEIRVSEQDQKGKGYWKLNNSILDEADFIQEMLHSKTIWINETAEIVDARIRWEMIKYKIRLFCIKYCSNKRR